MISMGPIDLTTTDVVMFVTIFILIGASIGAYFLHSYIKRKQFKKYDEERMKVFQERLAKINKDTEKSSE